tara:strand:+ start:395 stop:1201 length:807 start_codon:yes stop_codon:yes gene_type:complete
MKILKHNLTHDNYYQNTDYVSNSMLNYLTNKSPEYFRFMMDNPQPATSAMKLGSAFHMNVLQPQKFNKNYVILSKFDRRTKQGKEDYANFCKKNISKTIISGNDYILIEQMTDKLMRDSDVKTLISRGVKESIIVWNNEEYNVNCKGMLDVYREDSDIIIDLKTTQDSSYNAFTSSVRKFKYYKQAAYYVDAVRAQEFFIVAIEKTPPFGINIIQLGDDLLDKGREMYNQELEIYKYCMEHDYWPGEGFDYLDENSERTIHLMNEDLL